MTLHDEGPAFEMRRQEDALRAKVDALIAEEEAERQPGYIGIPVDALRVDRFLDRQPPKREMLTSRIPLAIPAFQAGQGGTGKSQGALQLAVSVAAGIPWLGQQIESPGPALMLCAEDDDAEIHRRLRNTLALLRQEGEYTDAHATLLRERLFIKSVQGEDWRLTVESPEGVQITGNVERIIATARETDARLIVLDPLARLRSGNENDNDAATRFVHALDMIVSATKATVMVLHHMAKGVAGAGVDRLTQEHLRGASAFVDGARYVLAMATLRKDCADVFGIEPDQAGFYVRMDQVKSNYTAPWDGMWLRRAPSGVLYPTRLRRQDEAEQRREDRYQTVLPKLVEKVRKAQMAGEPLTRNRLRNMAGRDGPFGIGDTTLRGIIERAIDDGAITEKPGTKGGKTLGVW
jgi:RecA-family ATPase